MKAATRTALLRIHRWTGLVLAPLLLVQGATGASLVYRDAIDRWLHPALVVAPGVARRPVATIAAAALAAEPGARIERIALPEAVDDAAIIRLRGAGGDARLVAVDPWRGTVLRHGGLMLWPSELIFQLHYTLLAGPAGRIIVGLEGIGLLVLAVLGWWIWFPGTRRWRSGFRLVRGTSDRLVRSGHRAAGGALAVLIAVSAMTGIILALKPQIAPLIGARAKPAPIVTPRTAQSLLPLDRLIALARADQGGLEAREVRIGGKAGQAVTVYLDDPTALNANEERQITLDGYDGRVIARHLPASLPIANAFLSWPNTIHTGEALGPVGRLLALLSGAALALFAGSGGWLWWSRTGAARARRAQRSSASR